MTREFTCRDCGQQVFDASGLERSRCARCAGCTWLLGIKDAEDRERIRIDLVAKGIIGDKLPGNSPIGKLTVCKLPHQNHFFVHSSIGGIDAWLKTNGTWSPIDGDPTCCLEGNEHLNELVKSGGSFADAMTSITTQDVIDAAAEAMWVINMKLYPDALPFDKMMPSTQERFRAMAYVAIETFKTMNGGGP